MTAFYALSRRAFQCILTLERPGGVRLTVLPEQSLDARAVGGSLTTAAHIRLNGSRGRKVFNRGLGEGGDMVRRLALGIVLVVSVTTAATVSPASAHDATIVAYLTGAAERPGPGDPDGVGRAYITTHLATSQLCLVLQWANVDGTLSGLHIHLAPPTSSGPVVVEFAAPSGGSGQLRQCVPVPNSDRLHNIAHNPQQHYINLHSTPLYGAGAIRGQLQRI